MTESLKLFLSLGLFIYTSNNNSAHRMVTIAHGRLQHQTQPLTLLRSSGHLTWDHWNTTLYESSIYLVFSVSEIILWTFIFWAEYFLLFPTSVKSIKLYSNFINDEASLKKQWLTMLQNILILSTSRQKYKVLVENFHHSKSISKLILHAK